MPPKAKSAVSALLDGEPIVGAATNSEASPTLADSLFPVLLPPVAVLFICFFAMLPMTWQQQAVFGGLFIFAAWLLHRFHAGRRVTIALAMLSLCATARYAFWRGSSLYEYLFSPWQHASPLSGLMMLLLLGAEGYSFLILLLGFVQTIMPLRRPVKPLPSDRSLWPTVDIMIPTYNEPLEIVRYTVLAAQEIDWPKDRLTITILDDGERADFEEFAQQVGVGYIARTDHSGAKAGNLNNAIEQTLGDYVAIFDCDHIPTRSFLRLSMGWFLADTKLALIQTPHHFYSPDPFERNLNQFRTTPNEGSLFYGIVQDANDLWNATFFCGSCAVIRRTALEEVGGIAQETVTEDAHTSLRLQRAGWNTAYINLPQAAGLATDTLAGHVRQRIRWARGMAQILRIDNPLFGRGLRLSQRLCYLNATLHYLYGIPRLLFLTAPLLYLFFGLSIVPGYWAAILAFATPHLLLSNIANTRIQGGHRHSCWNEIYETVLAPYIVIPTTVALIAPRHGTFNVTAKGGLQDESYFDRVIARPFLILLALNFAGLCFAIPRYLYWDHNHGGTIAINVFWTFFNVVILGAALAVCYEQRQRRQSTRVNCALPVRLHGEHGAVDGVTTNLSNGGLGVRVSGQWKSGSLVRIEFPSIPQSVFLAGQVCSHKAKQVRLSFLIDSVEDERNLTRVLYSAPNRWAEWYSEHAHDRPLKSVARILRLGMTGLWRTLTAPKSRRVSPSEPEDESESINPRRKGAVTAAILLLVCAGTNNLLGEEHPAKASAAPQRRSTSLSSATVGPFPQTFTLGSVATQDVLLQQPGSSAFLRFGVPDTWFIQSGTLHLRYTLPGANTQGGAPADQSIADVRLNDTNLISITPSQDEMANGGGEIDIPLPAELLVHKNTLVFQLAGEANTACTRSQQKSIPLHIDPASYITLNAVPLHIASDLHRLPHPFLEHLANSPAVMPVVFGHQPSSMVLQAAGIVSSWLGVNDDATRMHFPARIGSLPSGNAIVFLTGADDNLQAQLNGLSATDLHSVAMVDNPTDPFGKLLVVRGRTDSDLLSAAQALVLQQRGLTGAQASLEAADLPPERAPDDAPRWIHSDRIQLSQIMAQADRKTTGADPVNLYLHLAPDYNFGSHQRLYLHLNYLNDAPYLSRTANITAQLNGQTIDSYPLRSGHSRAIDIPLTNVPMATYANTLQINFYAASSSTCTPTNNHTHSEVLGSSYFDMGGAVHHASLPNLKLFAKAGFPFTRVADLGDTAVLLPDNPSIEAVSFYLDLMSYFGAQTGYPVLRVQVGSIAQAEDFGDKDLLVLGSFDDLATSDKLTGKLPASLSDGGVDFSLLSRLSAIPKALNTLDLSSLNLLREDGDHPADGLVAGFESPFSSGRSVVVALARENSLVPSMALAMASAMPADAIDETATIWNAGAFQSYPLLTNTYFVDSLPWYRSLAYSLAQMPLVLIAILGIVVLVLSAWTVRWLMYRVRQRLRPFHEWIGEPDTTTSSLLGQ